jgi:hypothetical protein
MEIAISIKIGFPTIVNSVPYYFHSKDFEKDFQCFMRIVFVYLGWDGNYEEKQNMEIRFMKNYRHLCKSVESVVQ